MLLATTILTAIGVSLGFLLGVAGRYFAVSEDNPLVSEIKAMLPGSQCGQCGFPGCSAAAAALANGQARVNCCPPGGRALAEQLSTLLGVAMDGDDVMQVPVVASIHEAQCTGCTRCFRACPTDAIVGANGQIHVVMQSACTGCRKCAEACPENCVSLDPEPATLEKWHWPKPVAA